MRNLFPPFSDTPKPIDTIFHLIPVYLIEMLMGIRRYVNWLLIALYTEIVAVLLGSMVIELAQEV